MVFIVVGVVVVALVVGGWLLQRRFPGRIDLRADPGARAVRDKARAQSDRLRQSNHNGGPGGFPGGL